jgi:poly-gamma-glutamate synthesis protein (capsule biosynthesis protein)
MEKGKTKVLVALLILILIGLGYLTNTRFVSFRSDDSGGVLSTNVTSTISKSTQPIEILLVGDIMLDRTVRLVLDSKGPDYIFGDIKNLFGNLDIAVGNLEGAITWNESVAVLNFNKLKFTFDPSTAKMLKDIGFTGMNMANNHALDFGQDGFSDTEKNLQEAHLDFFGSPLNDRNFLSTKIVRGERVCFLGFHALYNPDVSPIVREIKNAKEGCDYIVVYPHWGVEYEASPSKSQVEAGHALIDAGADLIIGTHPHVVEPVEIYKGKAIFYSLGNFIFDQDFSLPTRQGLAIRLELTKTEQKFHLIGVEMKGSRLYYPELEAYENTMSILTSLLSSLQKEIALVDGVLVLER